MSTFVISNKTTQILCKFTGGRKAHDWEISSAQSQFFLERTLDHRRDTLDPTIGYLHTCRPGRAALVYDLMEPRWAWDDCRIWDFSRSQTFTPQDFLMVENGACRLHPRLTNTVIEKTVDRECIFRVVESAKTYFSLQILSGSG